MIYLDNAATTFPKPLCVTDEISRCIKKYCGNPGRSSHQLSVKSAEKIYEARSMLAKMFDGDEENVVFTLNTTYALNIAIKSLIKYSTHVLISDMEHNSVFRPIYRLSKEKLCTFDIFSTGGTDEEIINNIISKIKPNTSMLVATHQSNVGVRKLPIEKIGQLCKERGIKFIVDGAQSAGVHPIKLKSMNIDALCIPAHKGLYGPQGVGAVIFNTDKFERSVIEGGTGVNSLEENMPDFLPELFEAGTLPTPAIAGFCEALKWLISLDISKIRAHEEDLYNLTSSLFKENKKIIPYYMNDYSGNTLLFNIKNIPSSTVGEYLNKKGICVRSGFHCSPLAHRLLNTGDGGAVRVSFGIYNSRSDVYQLMDALNELSVKK
ncbi:MAG: aminotransferase class V-fold PLP-dependent enzyme [Clostridia bacterium]|nr:aminotransferase class V-fold PLP-dependent enzyme [Clostridia bacterium]